MSAAVGVDGCRAGWVAASDDGVELHATFSDLLSAHPRARIAVDMPIGLLDAPRAGGRPCDTAARALLSPRGACVFSPPTRITLGARSFAEPKGLSLQCYHLLPKLREVDAAVTPTLQKRVRESHPELAFARLAGGPLAPKRTAEGRRQRERLVGKAPRVVGAKPDDVLDALVLARVAKEGHPFVVGGERDARGLRMEILSFA